MGSESFTRGSSLWAIDTAMRQRYFGSMLFVAMAAHALSLPEVISTDTPDDVWYRASLSSRCELA